MAKKTHPERPDRPPEWDLAPAAIEPGATWDGVAADKTLHVPQHVPDLTLHECQLSHVDLAGRRFTGLRCRDSHFEQCDLSGADLTEAILTRVAFTNCRLTGVILGGAQLTDVLIAHGRADLANMRMASASHLRIEDTALHAADFYSFAGTDCAFVDCDLREANFADAGLEGARLHGSILDDVQGALSLRGAKIGPGQLLSLGAALLAALEIEVTNDDAG